ncbi:MAG: hypothetical protein EPGJADBJ_04796 [Saprospiraceae bacterium]|nr:hypothetical protein [Saprospiraceae bacterium]
MQNRFTAFTFLLFNPFLLFSQQWEKLQMPVLTGAQRITQVRDTLVLQNDKCLYKSTDGGLTWQPIVSNDYTIIGFFPDTAHQRYYYLDGPNRIYESADFGTTWAQTGALPVAGNLGNAGLVFVDDEVYAWDQYYILHKTPGGPLNGWQPLLYLPQDTFAGSTIEDLRRIGNAFWAATSVGIRYSDDDGMLWSDPLNKNKPSQIAAVGDVMLINYPNPPSQLYRSLDAGTTWLLINPNIKPDKIFDSGGYFFAEKNDDLYRSTDGIIWEKILKSDFPMLIEDVAAQNGTILTAYTSDTDINGYLNSLLRSSDGGQTWLHSTEGLTCGSIYGGIAPLQSMEGYLIAGANYGFSGDEGYTWTRPFVTGSPTSDLLRIGNHYFGFDGLYFYRCPANGRFEWEHVFTGLGLSQIFDINGQLYSTDGQTIYHSTDAGTSWEPTGTAPSNQQFAIVHGKLVTTKDSSVVVSTDAGANWTTAHTFTVPVTLSTSRLYGFNDTLFLSYVPKKTVFVSADDGLSFDTLATPINPGNSTYRLRASGDNLYLWTGENNLLHISTDNGQNWLTLVMPAGYLIPNELEYIAIDKKYIYASQSLKMYCWRLWLDALRSAKGIVFFDANGNGEQDPGEPGTADLLIESSNAGALCRSNATGRFSMTLGQTADTLRIADVPLYFEAIPDFAVSETTDTQLITFGLHPLDTIPDVAVSLVNAAPFRAGFNSKLTATLRNKGTLTLSGIFHLVLDEHTALVTADPPLTGQSGDTLFWSYSALKPFEAKMLNLEVTTSTVLPGTPVNLQVSAQLIQDVQQNDNLFVLNEVVTASYDPNDKSVTPSEIPIADVSDKELTYTVRFQNLGNIATDFVVIRDTLSDLLDASTLRILSASHPCSWNIHSGGALEFRFSPIMLTPAQTDEANSHGFVRFSVKMKPGTAIGAIAKNTAHIYFDFNPAITTNTVETIVKQFVSTVEQTKVGKVTMSPNPADQNILIQINSTEAAAHGVVTVYSLRGQQLRQFAAQGTSLLLPTQYFATGTYLVRWQTGGKNYIGKFIVHHP